MESRIRKSLVGIAGFTFALVLTAVASAGQVPIGMLKVQGQAKITAPASTFTLEDQEYAYFSGDHVETTAGAKSVVHLNDGLDITFIGAATGVVTQQDGSYDIDLEQGHMIVQAESGVDFHVTHDGKPVSPEQALGASSEPFVVSVADSGDVRFYMPAQLDQGDEQGKKKGAAWLKGSLERAGISAAQAAAIVAALVAGGYVILHDDNGPSS